MKDETKIIIIVTKKGIERVQIYGSFKNQEQNLKLYNQISPYIEQIDAMLRYTPSEISQ